MGGKSGVDRGVHLRVGPDVYPTPTYTLLWKVKFVGGKERERLVGGQEIILPVHINVTSSSHILHQRVGYRYFHRSRTPGSRERSSPPSHLVGRGTSPPVDRPGGVGEVDN